MELNLRTVGLLILILAIVIWLLIWMHAVIVPLRRAQEERSAVPVYIFEQPESSPAACPITISTPPAPEVESIPVQTYGVAGGGGLELQDPNPPDMDVAAWYPGVEVIFEIQTLPACTAGPGNRLPGPDNLTHSIAGEVQLSTSANNSNPNGGYIMVSEHAGLDAALPMTKTPFTAVLTQAEHDNLDRFNFFPSFDQSSPVVSNIELYSVSSWINLNAQCTITDDVATVTWDAFTIPDGCDANETWEIVVSVRDDSEICSTDGPLDIVVNVGDIETDTSQTTMDVQLASGTSALTHNILHCLAYAYPVSNKSAATTIPVSLGPAV